MELLDCKRVNAGASFSCGLGSRAPAGANSARIGEVLMRVSRTGGVREESDETMGIGAEIDRNDDSDFLVKSRWMEGLLGRFMRVDPEGEDRLEDDLRAESGVAGVAGNGTEGEMTSVVRGAEGCKGN